jgi:hypothetical protein
VEQEERLRCSLVMVVMEKEDRRKRRERDVKNN